MIRKGKFTGLRAIVRNVVVWGVGWSALSLATMAVLRLVGVLHGGSWIDYMGLAAKFGIIGGVAGGAFSTMIRFAYRGRRLSEISWVRFGIVGGIVTGLFVPTFLQTMNVISGDGLVPMRLLVDDIIISTLFGGVVAGVTMKLAQRTVASQTGA